MAFYHRLAGISFCFIFILPEIVTAEDAEGLFKRLTAGTHSELRDSSKQYRVTRSVGQSVMRVLETKADFDDFILSEKLSVVEFFATWCGPCHFIGPKFEAMMQNFPTVRFAEVNVDNNDETAEANGVTTIPTFLFYKNGQQLDRMIGNKEEKLRNLITQYG